MPAEWTEDTRRYLMTRWQQFTGMPFWITAIAACVLAGSAIVVMAHLISHSYASVPDNNALPGTRAAPEFATHAQDESAILPKGNVGLLRKGCMGCGVCLLYTSDAADEED